MSKLFLIDGSALAYRSFFSFISNPLTNKQGMQTSAIFGFTASLLRLMEKEKPDLLAVVFDAPDKTFRHEKFPAYKATREKMPDEMADQLPYIRAVVEAMRIPFLILPGFEADDIMGTLAVQAAAEKIDVYLVTGDKDFLQLLGPHVRLYNPKKAGEIEIVDAQGAQHKWGVSVEQVTDLLALMGDSSDNVPGVPGVGEKTATKLLQQFGSLDAIYSRIDEVTPPKLREKLIEHRKLAELCKELVTIHTNTPIGVSHRDLTLQSFDVPKLRALFEELDFHSLLNGLAGQDVKKTDTKQEAYQTITTLEGLRKLVEDLKKAPMVAMDTETTSLVPHDAKLVGMSFSIHAGRAAYVPWTKTNLSTEQLWKELRPYLENAHYPKGGHNVKYDRLVLKTAGIDLQGIRYDSMLESYLLDSGSRQHGLDMLSLTHLGIEKIATEELIGRNDGQITMADVDVEKISHYACEDVDMSLRLHELFHPQIEHQELGPLYRDVELPLVEVLGDMEYAGIKVDRELLKELSTKMNVRLKELQKGIYELAGQEFNLNSPKQLGPILFEKLKIQGPRRVKKTKTGYATDQETLENHGDHPMVKLMLEYRNLSKLLSTYAESLPTLIHAKTGKIHTSFNQTVAATGRLSSSDPNLQNIPIRTELGKEIRKAFVPSEPGWKLLSADYSQIELRILAHLADDETLLETFRKGEDVHRRTAALIFRVDPEKVTSELRGRAKAINFGVVYGMGPQRLARDTGITLKEAQAFIEAYFETYSSVKAYLDGQVEFAKERGYVATLLGRRRNIPDIQSTNPRLISNAERIATNTPIQGSAADLIKMAMVNIWREMKSSGLNARMLLQVHDELVFEAPENELPRLTTLVKNGMEHAIELKVPLLAEIGVGNNWADAH